MKLWSLEDFSCLRTFEGHSGSVLRAVFLPSQRQILSMGQDAILRLWDLRTGAADGAFPSVHEGKVWSLATDGRIAVTGGGDSRVCVWEDTTAEDKALAVQLEQGVVLQEQKLSDALRTHDWLTALELALELGQPRRLLAIFTALLQSRHSLRKRQDPEARLQEQRSAAERRSGRMVGDPARRSVFGKPLQITEDSPGMHPMYENQAALADVLSRLPTEKLGLCLKFILDWCVNAKSVHCCFALSLSRIHPSSFFLLISFIHSVIHSMIHSFIHSYFYILLLF